VLYTKSGNYASTFVYMDWFESVSISIVMPSRMNYHTCGAL